VQYYCRNLKPHERCYCKTWLQVPTRSVADTWQCVHDVCPFPSPTCTTEIWGIMPSTNSCGRIPSPAGRRRGMMTILELSTTSGNPPSRKAPLHCPTITHD
jgi:hypothetical protein